MNNETELIEALGNILWKLERKEENDGLITWAKIDRNDAVIRSAQSLFCKMMETKLNV